MASGDLTTLQAVKAWLKVSTTEDDGLLEAMIAACSAFIEQWTGRRFALTDYIETQNGNGSNMVVLPNYPVTAIHSVIADGVSIPAAAGLMAAGYTWDEIGVYLRGYRFETGLRNVQISYSAGFAAIPADLERAAIELIALRYKERDRIGHASKSLAGETVSFITADMPASVRAALNNWRRVVPA